MKKRKKQVIILLAVVAALVFSLFLPVVGKWMERRRGARDGIWMPIEDNSCYAKNADYTLYGYTRYLWDGEQMLRAERYDGDGWQREWIQWIYDTAGRPVCERFCDNPGHEGETEREIRYEYDKQGELVQQQVYQAGILEEESFYRPLEDGYAGVCYTYEVTEEEENKPLWQIASWESFVCREQGEPLYRLQYDKNGLCWEAMRARYDESGRLLTWTESTIEEARQRVYVAEWKESGDLITNTVTCFGRTVYTETYLRDPATGALLMTAHMPKDREDNEDMCYLAAYDGSLLLWEMSCEEGKLDCFRALRYEQGGICRQELACVAYDGGFDCVLRRYEYNDRGQAEGMYDYESRIMSGGMGTDGSGGSVAFIAEAAGQWPLVILVYDPDGTVAERIAFDETGRLLAEKMAEKELKEKEGETKYGNDRNRFGNDQFTGRSLAGRKG